MPFNGFYEWLKDIKEQKQPYYIRPKQEPYGIASFAGVWGVRKDDSGKEWHTYSIITTSPNKEMGSIHNRMPVILHPEDEPKWLDPSIATKSSLEPLLRPTEDNGLQIYKVSKDVNSPRLNYKELIYAIDE